MELSAAARRRTAWPILPPVGWATTRRAIAAATAAAMLFGTTPGLSAQGEQQQDEVRDTVEPNESLGFRVELPSGASVQVYPVVRNRSASNRVEAALGVMDEMVLLQAARGAAFPAEFSWQYAQVARSAGDTVVAVAALRHYLALAGPSGKHSKEARRMLGRIEVRAGMACFLDGRWRECPPKWSDLHMRRRSSRY